MFFRASKLAFILLIFASPALAAKALIFSDCVKYDEESGCKEQNLMVYKFTNGVVSKEEYSRLPVDEESPAPFDSYTDPSEIVQNRYIMTGERIYDLKERKFIHDGYSYDHIKHNEGDEVYYTGRRIKVLEDQVVYTGGDEGTDLYVYDLNKHTYGKATQEQEKQFRHWALWGTFSPDFQKTLTSEKHDSVFRLVLNTADATKVLADDLKTETSADEFPFAWLDNDTAITQVSDGQIVTVDLGGTVTPLVKIFLNPPSSPYIYIGLFCDEEGFAFYSFGGATYKINPKTKTFAEIRGRLPQAFVSFGNDFEAESYDQERTRGRKILHKGKVIGEYHFGQILTTEGHVVLEYYPSQNDPEGQRGLALWSADSGQWTEVKVEFLQGLIGWVDLE